MHTDRLTQHRERYSSGALVPSSLFIQNSSHSESSLLLSPYTASDTAVARLKMVLLHLAATLSRSKLSSSCVCSMSFLAADTSITHRMSPTRSARSGASGGSDFHGVSAAQAMMLHPLHVTSHLS